MCCVISILAAVQSFYIEIGHHSRFFTCNDNIERMTTNADDGSICFNIFHGFLHKVDPASLHEPIRNLPLQLHFVIQSIRAAQLAGKPTVWAKSTCCSGRSLKSLGVFLLSQLWK